MTDNVVLFSGPTTLDLPPERLLQKALEADLGAVVIFGTDKYGGEYFASSLGETAQTMYYLQRGIHRLNQMADDDD